jgi:hypothetical protein
MGKGRPEKEDEEGKVAPMLEASQRYYSRDSARNLCEDQEAPC